MKLDFDYIQRIADQLHRAYLEDGGEKAYLEGRHVFNLQFEPETKSVEVHVLWPMFKQLVANEAEEPAKYSTVPEIRNALHFSCKVQGVKLVAILYRYILVEELKALELPEDCELCESDDIENLLALWQNMTGWNLGWTSQKEDENNG